MTINQGADIQKTEKIRTITMHYDGGRRFSLYINDNRNRLSLEEALNLRDEVLSALTLAVVGHAIESATSTSSDR